MTLEYVNIKYPEDQWTHAYTDGSAAEATRDGGGRVYIRYNGEIAQISIATGKYSTNFKAEAEAPKKRTKPNVVIFTDALSVLSKLQNSRQKDLNLAAQSNLTLQMEKTIIKTLSKKKWKQQHPNITSQTFSTN